MRTSEQVDAIFAALAKAQGEFPTIVKTKQGKVTGENKQGKSFSYTYVYADIADVFAAVLPVLSSNGLAVIQPTRIDGGAIFLITRVGHSSGQWIESDYPVCSVTGDHQRMGAALTYARRYGLCALIGAAADDDQDGEGAEHAAAPAAQPRQRERTVSERMADEMIVAVGQRPTIVALERFWLIPDVKRDLDLMDEADQARVKEADAVRRAEIESGGANLMAG